MAPTSHSLRLDVNSCKSNEQKTWSSTHMYGLSPNLQPATPPVLVPNPVANVNLPAHFGDKYILVEQFETSNLFRCFDTQTNDEFCCKMVPTKSYHQFLSGHLRMDSHSAINRVQEVLVGRQHTYVLFCPAFGDLHSYVRANTRLRESEAIHLFHQIVSIVADCHNNGIILRDLKLRKFLFSNKERTQLKLETLEDAAVLDDWDNDMLTDKHGCPAYVSPEILSTEQSSYSARQADCWSLGVILYTILVGRYPFNDTNPSVLFSKIKRGSYVMPELLSAHAKCLIRSLMRRDPSERLTAEDILSHRWFKNYRSVKDCKYKKIANTSQTSHPTPSSTHCQSNRLKTVVGFQSDQTVPDLIDNDSDSADGDDSSLTQSLSSDL